MDHFDYMRLMSLLKAPCDVCGGEIPLRDGEPGIAKGGFRTPFYVRRNKKPDPDPGPWQRHPACHKKREAARAGTV